MQSAADVHVIGPGRAPEEVVTALQAIDPKAELVHLAGKRWWLGIRAPNPHAQDPLDLENARTLAATRPVIEDPAERALAEFELGLEFQMRQVMAAGFKPVMLYVLDPNGDATDPKVVSTLHEIVEDFRVRDFNHRTKSPQQIEREIKAAVSIDLLNRDRIRAWGKKATECAAEAFRFVFKGARSNQSKVRRRARRSTR